MIKVGALYKKDTAKGEILKGKFGDAELVVMPNGFKTAENHPDFIVYIDKREYNKKENQNGQGSGQNQGRKNYQNNQGSYGGNQTKSYQQTTPQWKPPVQKQQPQQNSYYPPKPATPPQGYNPAQQSAGQQAVHQDQQAMYKQPVSGNGYVPPANTGQPATNNNQQNATETMPELPAEFADLSF